MTVEYMGNKALLGREMTAFLAPSHVSPLAVLPTLDWASAMSHGTRPVVSGFTSRLEKEVWSVLTRGTSPIVKVMVQNPYKRVPSDLQPLFDDNRLLVIFLGIAPRLSRQNAAKRNAYVARLAAELVFPSIDETSSLFPICQDAIEKGKKVTIIKPL